MFYFSDPKTLEFLKDGWGPIIDLVDKNKPKNQERLLIGLTGKNSNRNKIKERIQNVMEQLKCTQYFEEGPLIEPSNEKVGSFTIQTNLIKHITSKIASSRNSKNDEINQSMKQLSNKSSLKSTVKDQIKNKESETKNGDNKQVLIKTSQVSNKFIYLSNFEKNLLSLKM